MTYTLWNKQEILKAVSFGQRVAEEETDALATYFVETDQWIRLFRGDIDVVYGPKGSGKSALYSLLLAKSGELFDKGVLLIPAENPRGDTAFQNLALDPPASEREFVGLWKLYIAALLQNALVDFDIQNEQAKQLERALMHEGLIKGQRTLGGLLQRVYGYLRRAFRPESVEGTVHFDPTTQLPAGFSGKISFSEPEGSPTSDPELYSVDALLKLANDALSLSNVHTWVLLDRLDVAFAENTELESNALRALFRVYLDLGALTNITLKIFLRTDIWHGITEQGFREASHVTRDATITWNRNSLLNLVARRSLYNESIRQAYKVSDDLSHQSVGEQEEYFYRLFPQQVDVGPNKPNTLDWLLSRTRDGSKANAPRELIHFLNSLRDVQVRRFEIGEAEPRVSRYSLGLLSKKPYLRYLEFASNVQSTRNTPILSLG